LTYSEEEGEVFLGHSVTQHKVVSDETAHIIDEEIRSVVDRNYKRAEQLLTENAEKLGLMADALIKYETIDAEQIKDIMMGKVPRPPGDWSDGDAEPPADTAEKDDEKPASGKIGGPASSH
jgi:cell division protease FtsH